MTIKLAASLAAISLATALGAQSAGAINTYNAEPAPERTEVGALSSSGATTTTTPTTSASIGCAAAR